MLWLQCICYVTEVTIGDPFDIIILKSTNITCSADQETANISKNALRWVPEGGGGLQTELLDRNLN